MVPVRPLNFVKIRSFTMTCWLTLKRSNALLLNFTIVSDYNG
jgi:hypothetical protein